MGHTAELLNSGGTILAAAGAGLTLWVGVLAASTITRCLGTSDWLPEGTEPELLVSKGLTVEQVRRDQLENVTEKIQKNKARLLKLAHSLTVHRWGTVLSPLGYLAGLLAGWLFLV